MEKPINKDKMTETSPDQNQGRLKSVNRRSKAVDKQSDGIAELTESLNELKKSVDALASNMNRMASFVHDFYRWNPTTGSLPNTRVIKSWRATVKDVLETSQNVVTNSEKVFNKIS